MALHTGGYLTQRLPGRLAFGLRCPRTAGRCQSRRVACGPPEEAATPVVPPPRNGSNDQLAGALNHSMSVLKPGTSFSHLWWSAQARVRQPLGHEGVRRVARGAPPPRHHDADRMPLAGELHVNARWSRAWAARSQ